MICPCRWQVDGVSGNCCVYPIQHLPSVDPQWTSGGNRRWTLVLHWAVIYHDITGYLSVSGALRSLYNPECTYSHSSQTSSSLWRSRLAHALAFRDASVYGLSVMAFSSSMSSYPSKASQQVLYPVAPLYTTAYSAVPTEGACVRQWLRKNVGSVCVLSVNGKYEDPLYRVTNAIIYRYFNISSLLSETQPNARYSLVISRPSGHLCCPLKCSSVTKDSCILIWPFSNAD